MKQPLDCFADRIIANDEVKEFVAGLMDKGITAEMLQEAIKEAVKARQRPSAWRRYLRNGPPDEQL